jgi:hypothetical protein
MRRAALGRAAHPADGPLTAGEMAAGELAADASPARRV